MSLSDGSRAATLGATPRASSHPRRSWCMVRPDLAQRREPSKVSRCFPCRGTRGVLLSGSPRNQRRVRLGLDPKSTRERSGPKGRIPPGQFGGAEEKGSERAWGPRAVGAGLSTSLSTSRPPHHPKQAYSTAANSAYSWLVTVLGDSWKANRFPGKGHQTLCVILREEHPRHVQKSSSAQEKGEPRKDDHHSVELRAFPNHSIWERREGGR